MHTTMKKLPLLIAAAAATAGSPFGSLAQDTDRLTLEEVIVTARKRSESLQSTPVSAAVFDSAAMARAPD